MARTFVTKTSFTAGELDPRLLGRLDLKAQEDGAARLRNVLVQATGGVARRPGLARVAALPGARRLVSFETSYGPALVALGSDRLHVFRHGRVIVGPGSVWSEAQIAGLDWTRSGDRLLIVHPQVAPMALVERGEESFELEPWRFETSGEGRSPPAETFQPYARFAPAGVRLELRDAQTGRKDAPIEAGRAVEIVTTPAALTPAHEGSIIRYKGVEVTVGSVDPIDPTQATGILHAKVENGLPTWDWDEQAFSTVHGWPATLTVYQDRLVVGGSRDASNQVWMSRTGRHFNFDTGEGLDDESVSFRLGGDELHTIRALQPGRQLQVFTTAGEWVVRGVPVTPDGVQVELQTRVGSWAGPRRLRPVDVDGATLFVGASGRELREFLFADSEQAYQAADIALLARHLLADAVDAAFDGRRRLLLIPRADGAAAAVTIDRNSNVVGWSLIEAAGKIRAACVHQGELWFLVELEGRVSLERLDDALGVDHARPLTSPDAPRQRWTGLDELEGWPVVAIDETSGVTRARVEAGAITTARPARRITVGLPFTHEVEPMPIAVATGRGVSLDHPYRPVRVTFRVLETGALRADLGEGSQPLLPTADAAAAGQRFTGDLASRALGWRRGLGEPPWRVAQDDPVPATILSVSTEIRVND